MTASSLKQDPNTCKIQKNAYLLTHTQSANCGGTKILHALKGMGSTALEAAVPYLGKVTQISHKG